jgi:hypothetical protein
MVCYYRVRVRVSVRVSVSVRVGVRVRVRVIESIEGGLAFGYDCLNIVKNKGTG